MENKIRIGFIISNLGQGGAERQFLELIKNIDKSSFDVSVCLYAINKGIFYKEIEEIDGINLKLNILKSKNKALKILEALRYIRNYLQVNNFDIVYTTLFMNGFFVRIIAPNKYKNKIITSIRTSFASYNKFHRFVEKFLINKSYVVLNSKNAEDDFRLSINKKYHDRIFLIYNGFDAKRFSKNWNRESKNPIIIGNIGRMTYQKNQIQLLRFIRMLSNRKLKLIIIGAKGDQSELLKNYINDYSLNDQVDLIDAVSNIEKYYNSFDIFILPSFYEGCPNVLFEAMLSKRLCIVSSNANSDGFIKDGINGFVYDGSDEGLLHTFKNALLILGEEKEKQIIENAFEYAIRNFGMNVMVHKYENIFIKLNEKNKARYS